MPDPIFELITALEADIATYYAAVATTPVTTITGTTVVNPSPVFTPVTTVISPPENASEAAARAAIAADVVADATEVDALVALTPAETAVVATNTTV
jgi:hypothetical protein